MKYNIITDTDAYKVSQWLQYPPGMTNNFSYFESRGGEYSRTLFFGLQYILKEHFLEPLVRQDVFKGENFWTKVGLPFNFDGWMHIVEEHGGQLPIRIRAVPEGTVVPTSNALFTVESTCPKVPWITSWVETALARVWYPTTVATRSLEVWDMLVANWLKTSDEPIESLLYKLHGFGARGGTSQESSQIGDMAHLVVFRGTDTGAAIAAAFDYYGEYNAGVSLPASEHSTMTAWGRDREVDAYRNMLEKFGGPGKAFACVSDSYDVYNAVDNIWGEELKQEVIDSGSIVIVRPDSGDPVEVTIDLLQRLVKKYGVTTNSKKFDVLNSTREIQGDGIGPKECYQILSCMYDIGLSVDNIFFGMGAGLIQKLDRDTCKFAFKCSEVTIKGQHIEVFKDPVTDHGKRSKVGRLDLIEEDGELYTQRIWWNQKERENSAMQTVYEDGKLLIDQTFEEIRERAKNG